jgi:BirA family transcriptional regulator, biotin operon repressor / biotin---[acetyl-CoA-carboxylase] ligase
MNLDASVAAAGVRLLAFDTLGSTNTEALARARAGERGPLWITAACQTAGRGRRGRSFVSERGNLYATLLVTDASPVERAAELAFVAALAAHDAVVDVATELGARLALKWPNDLLYDGAKLAGILVEGESASGRPLVTVVGIGINCAHHPAQTDHPATDLLAAGTCVTPEVLFTALSRAMLERLREWDRGRGFAATRAAWLARAASIGMPVRVNFANRQLEGRFETLDACGRLVLRLGDGTAEIITAGDVFPISQEQKPPSFWETTTTHARRGGSQEAGDLTSAPSPPIEDKGRGPRA